MLLIRASIGRKLLLAFSIVALLMLIAAVIGVSGFSLVARTERAVINSAVPALVEARHLSDLSTRIISTAQVLAQAETEQERQLNGRAITLHIESLLQRLQGLGSYQFDAHLLKALDDNVQGIIDNLANLGVLVGKKILLKSEVNTLASEMTKRASQVEELASSQVLNSNTIAVANVTKIYDLVESGEQEAIYNALDTLVEVDLDLAERLHELRLLAFKIINTIDDAKSSESLSDIEILHKSFQGDIHIILRRVKAVEDPSRSLKMTELTQELVELQRIFSRLKTLNYTQQNIDKLSQQNLIQFQELNETVDKLITQANRVTTTAVSHVNQTLNMAQSSLVVISLLGIVIVALIMWRYVYAQVITRLNQYSQSLESVSDGKLDFDFKVTGQDELAKMGRSILIARDTAKELVRVAEAEALIKQELQAHKNTLEELVMQRTEQLQTTNQKLNDEVLNHAKARAVAEQANKAKSAFLATMSHEIRTPMNGVLGTASLLKESGLTLSQKHYVDVINRSGESLLDILNDVLDYSKIEAGHLEIASAPFHLKNLIDDVYYMLESRATAKGLTLVVEFKTPTADYYLGDVTRIRQVLINLVGNAIKFTEEGEVTIVIGSGDTGDKGTADNLLFEVTDTGIGISTREQACLFEAFTQASAGKRAYGGTGLGLAISQRLIHAMNGEIGVDSKEEQGSSFWFSVPLIETSPIEQPDSESSEKVIAKVLLVEDNPVNCLVAEGFLKRLGHQVVTAVDGISAEQVIEHQDFDLLLLDINLPDTDGVTLMHRLRRIENNKGIDKKSNPTPAFAFSAHVFNEEVEGYLSAGFDGFLPKPLVEKQLEESIVKALSGRDLLLDQSVVQGAELSLSKDQEIEHEGFQSDSEALVILDDCVLANDLAVLGDKQISKLVSLFEMSSNDTLKPLLVALKAEDYKAVADLAHRLKGSASSLGLQQLHQLCLQFEVAGKEGDLSQCKASEMAYLVEASQQALHERFG
ncbi:TMAO reductase system sensor histidine kinase/response regulator TorS [Vibrio sp. Of7-15]|uniref:TMAO reductase system sensor histidine kinase/response regulator TorS n=1 Tax=Vibrio sp. Of7-15 TaxID=2724879 RepID=UPI001EF1E339|nr:TMAO reductase system sensor histidine kinase/response regulator TorS [Vibrio sp. Of7-15]MCG7497791.1 TMAO reductase system sensor histidine kinase/response regulator TorS [Vibrio sp. Of7-15]